MIKASFNYLQDHIGGAGGLGRESLRMDGKGEVQSFKGN